MIEESLMEFLKDRHAEMRLLYELAATATGSYKFRSDGCGMLRRVYKGVKLWWQLLDLPCVEKNHHHGNFLVRMKPVKMSASSDCMLEVFAAKFGLPMEQAPPCAVVIGTKKEM